MNEPAARIFIVEDEALIQMEIGDRLSQLGYVVCGAAARGEVAIGQIAETAPDLVLMDINLAGEIDGIETARRLRERSRLPIVFLTAYSDDALLRRAGETDPFGYLMKPFRERELHATIQMALLKHRLERTLHEANERLEEQVRERTAHLAASERRFADFAHIAADWLWETGPDGRFVYFSPRGNQSGLNEQGTLGHIHQEGAADNPENRVRLAELAATMDRREPFQNFLYQTLSKDGEPVWCRTSGEPMFDAHGAFLGYRGTGHDVTAPQDAQDSLLAKTRILDAMLAAMPDGVQITDANQRDVIMNDQLFALLAFDKEVVRASPDPVRFARLEMARRGEYGPGNLETLVSERIAAQDREIAAHGAYRYERQFKHGKWIEGRILPIEGGGRLELYRDITEAKSHEREVERQAALLKTIVTNIDGGIIVLDSDMRLALATPNLSELIGIDPAMLRVGIPHRDLILSQARAGEFGPCDPEAEVDRIIQERWQPDRNVWERARPNGRSLELRRQRIPGGGFVTIYLDTTERRKAERALYEHRHLLSAIVATTQQGFWFTDNKGIATDVNPAMVAILGRSREDIVGKHILTFVDEENTAVFHRELQKRAAGSTEPYEIVLRRPDGTSVSCINKPAPRYDQSGKWVGTVGIWTDITALKDAERALRDANATLEHRVAERTAALAESLRFNNATLDAIDAHVAVLDGDGRILATNIAWRHFAAASDLDWQQTGQDANYLDVCEGATGACAEDAHAVAAGIRDVIAGRRDGFTYEYSCHTPNEQRWFLCRVSRFPSDGPVRVVVAHDNVTEVHEAMERAAAGERVFSLLSDVSPIGIYRFDAEGHSLEVSRRLLEIVGLPGEDAVGDGWTRHVHEDDRARVADAWSAAIRDGAPLHSEHRYVRADGTVVWVMSQAGPILSPEGVVTGHVGTLTDITERKRIELATQATSTDLIAFEGQAYYEQVTIRLADILDADFAFITRVNPANPGELQTVALVEDGALIPNMRYPVAGRAGEAVLTGAVRVIERGAHRQFPAHKFLVERAIESYGAVPLLDQSGRVLGHLGVMARAPLRDGASIVKTLKIFELAVTAEMIRERNRRQYRDLFEFAPDALVLWDREGRIVLVNRQAEEIFGWTRTELIGQSIEILMPPSVRQRHGDLRETFIKAPETRRMAAGQRALQARRKDGTLFPAEIALAQVETEDGVMTAAAVRDITLRRALEAQLAQATKMEALGKLTGGMAHDFNNYLGVIIGNLDLLREITTSDPDRTMLIDAALSGAARGAELTQSLLAFARRQPLDPVTTDLNQRVGVIAELLKRTLGEGVRIATKLSVDLWPVKIDGARLDSAIVNLANNARDAMKQGGTLTISSRNVHLDEHYTAANPGVVPGEYASIEVSDTGGGMGPETLAHVFDPFFTTKGPGHGTGLGLSMVYGFVKQSGGHIDIHSEAGHGTTLRIYLSRAEAAGLQEASAAPAEASQQTDTATILIVEDNERLRLTAVAQLKSLGYRVIEAANGEAALRILEQDEPHVNLLFTDVVMPGRLDGYALADRALEYRLGIKILLTSGFTGDTLIERGAHMPNFRLLTKPYRKDELARVVRTALEERTSAALSGRPAER
jgi:PAS domain S-box-containing protein